ncbi:protein timeless isoform X2 [Eurytemora carolleeae]|uniref:protein timeless isoform X2 n=1 Tax=Eurytemora carolleeae TaxID=1294199 RepID=UPI000C7738D9|nr:protein timeless isoform X2 [Eurytemora carolleeae]|eukprot:XP_023344362.1 protein timeless-like isoform X2 [Eurytemora affinis]
MDPLKPTSSMSKKSEYSSGEVESSISAPLKEGNGGDGEENNEPPSKRLKLWKLNSNPRRRLRTKKERDLKYKDLGISSGPGDGNSSEDEDTDTWLVKNSELSDLGYVSYMTENEKKKRRNVSNFDSLTEDEKRARWKKLSEARLKGTNRKSRTLFYYIATEADVLDILTDFAITFLLQGYLVLQEDILKIIRTSTSQDKEAFLYKEFFSWLIYYFLPLASVMSMPLNQLPLNYDIFHYLVSECSAVAIQVSLSRSPSVEDLKIISGYVRAQRCFVEILSKYEDNFQLDQIEKYNLKLISLQIVKTKNVRQLYVFLTWLASKKNLNSTQFLSDLVVANHIHLATIQSLNVFKADFNMTDHILQFSAPSMMTPYGFLLEKYRENTNTVNDCIFTMMHHVAGDLSCPQALNIEPMKKTIRQITKQGVVLCDDWQDLIEYLANFYSKTNATRNLAVRSVYSDPGPKVGRSRTSVKSEMDSRSHHPGNSPHHVKARSMEDSLFPSCSWQVCETEAIKPSADEPIVVKPTAIEITAVEPAAVKPITIEPTASKGVAVKPTAVERAAHDYEPTVEENSVAKRSAGECAASKPPAVESADCKRPAVESAAVETTAGEPKIEYEPEKENQVDEVRFLDKKKMRRMSGWFSSFTSHSSSSSPPSPSSPEH